VRKAANQNPVVQAALIGGLLLLFAILLYTRILGSDSGSTPATEDTTGTESTATPVAPAGSAAPSGDTAAPEAATTTPAAPTVPGGTATEFEAGEGLPKPVVNAYEDGEAVVLLIVKRRGIDDRPVQVAVKALRSRSDVAVFVTGAKNVADYSQITNGVGVSRAPALIVIQPQKVSGDVPKASVSYGFRGPQSVLQAVEDALYNGRNVPSYPE
jgi:hypothetical protein